MRLALVALAAPLALASTLCYAADSSITVANPRCEYRHNPLGIGTDVPRLSWEVLARDNAARGLSQKGYQILAASDPSLLKEGLADLWDSKPVPSDATAQIEYAGRALNSGQSVFWTVRTWDEYQIPSEWCPPQHLSLGLLEQTDWTAQWIGNDQHAALPLDDEERATLRGIPWLKASLPIARTPQSATFSTTLTLPAGTVKSAYFAGTADQVATLSINDTPAATITRWDPVAPLNVASALHAGENRVQLAVTQQDGFPPAATGEFVIQLDSGSPIHFKIDSTWKAQIAGTDAKAEETRGLSWGGNRNTEHYMAPASYLRKAFSLDKPIKHATLFSTALGLYWCELNGARISIDEFTPGWTEYSKRVYHQTYDVTASLKQGQNVLGTVLGDGWYAGLMGYTGQRHWYGGQPRFRAQLEIEFDDGTHQTISTDNTWKVATGPILHADNYMGCDYDSRLEMSGWSTAAFDASSWTSPALGTDIPAPRQADVTARLRDMLKDNSLTLMVNPKTLGDPAYGVVKTLTVNYAAGGTAHTISLPEGKTLTLPAPGDAGTIVITKAIFGELSKPEMVIEPQPGEPVRRFETLPSIGITEPLPLHYIFDLGQNMVGYVQLKIKGTRGQRLTLRHAEMLNPDGTLYTSNLRGATATDFFTLSGEQQTLEPKFTFHGFRYVEITGLTSRPDLATVSGIVIHTDMDRTATFECSNELVNKLYHNIIWGQKGNYLEVPTDCPQRDERLGWTGDAQFFINAASYNFDVSSFMDRWLKTLAHDAQFEDGTFAHVAPRVAERGGSTAWGDAAIVCTYAMYQRYGDVRLVQQNLGPIFKYLEWLKDKSHDNITHVGGFSDWLNLDDPTNNDLIDTAYRIELLRMAKEMVPLLSDGPLGAKRASLRGQHCEQDGADARASFLKKFLKPDGSLVESGQTGYALAYTMNLIPENLREQTATHFAAAIARKNNHLATGFIGTPRLLPALHLAGRDDLAYKILLNTDYPSWLYQVTLGATTMWERWDGWTPERGFQDVGMNSFNHYAFGSVGDFLIGTVTGIQPGENAYARSVIEPTPGPGLDSARSTYHSIRGEILSSWKRVKGGIAYDINIPANTSARVTLRTAHPELVTESDIALKSAKGISNINSQPNHAKFQVSSGHYRFFAPDPAP